MLELDFRPVRREDLEALTALEAKCFEVDRLSRRSFRHWIQSSHRHFIVATHEEKLVGYSLVIFFRGTTLARLYSVAVDPEFRGQGIARQLIEAGEVSAEEAGRLFLRLEVDVHNHAGIQLYEAMGYQRFGIYRNYYEDQHDAIRMQKCIRTVPPTAQNRSIPWLQQATPFTCGPAALMMAMRGLSKQYSPTPSDELQIWREATTIYMTAGHGGCHPVGLALAANLRGYRAEVWLNHDQPLFIDSVRDEQKKSVIEQVHTDFVSQARAAHIPMSVREFVANDLVNAFDQGGIPIILISTYRLDGKKSPHWVVMSGYDEDCLYVHDSDPDPVEQCVSGLDSQYLPIARNDFMKMSRFGKKALRTAVIIGPKS